MTPTARSLAEQLYVDLVGRSVFASGSPVKPDSEKLARLCIDFAQSFERIAAGMDKENGPAVAEKFDVQLDDIASWGKK